MKKIVILGAGLSSPALIRYLLDKSASAGWQVTVADASLEQAHIRLENHPHGVASTLHADDSFELQHIIQAHDIVISLLPPSYHVAVARQCIAYKKSLITASYVSDDMRHLHTEAVRAGVLLLNECGLDPGIDHMSAMRIIHSIQQQGGVIHVFKSYCGGLVAPDFDSNPWHYKFTWNPRNVVLAGQATASYLKEGKVKYIPPSRIFAETEKVVVRNEHVYDAYANRDSLSYIKPYGITSAHTVLRGTLRVPDYCEQWQHIVQLGLADDSIRLDVNERMTYREWVHAFVPGGDYAQLEKRIADFLHLPFEKLDKLTWLGLFDEVCIPFRTATSAQILQHLLQQKWKLNRGELDQIVMQHEFVYAQEHEQKTRYSSLIVTGENDTFTAMAKTVGLPLGIAAELVLQGKINLKGVHIPIMPELYNPILDALDKHGITFEETDQ